jgi:hypothetical protein
MDTYAVQMQKREHDRLLPTRHKPAIYQLATSPPSANRPPAWQRIMLVAAIVDGWTMQGL